MHGENVKSRKMYSAGYLVSLSYPSKCDFEQLGMKGEVPFFAYVHRAYTHSITRYDTFACGPT